MKRKLAIAGIVAAGAILAGIVPAPEASADPGSYLSDVRERHHALVDGFPDFALLVGGQKACMGMVPAPGMPELSAAVSDSAHRELCP